MIWPSLCSRSSRLVVGACLYVVLVFVTGAVRLDELQGLLRVVRQRRARVQPSAV